MPRITGNQFLAHILKGYGVSHVFYMLAIAKAALYDMKLLGIRPVLVHSEKAAAYMADGYARASHRPGVCFAQSVGAANLSAGLQDAYLGLSPVVAITGRRPPLDSYRHAYQEIVHPPLFAPVVKFDADVNSLDELPLLLRQAFREATSGAPAPVHLDLLGMAGAVTLGAEADLEITVEEAFTQYPAFRPEPSLQSVQEAALVLTAAQKPVIVAGGGVSASGAQEEVRKLAELLSIPVATSLNGKGTILEDHPLSVGVVGSYSRWCANQIVSEADLVMFIGSHTGSQVTNEWQVPPVGTPVIQIDIAPSELGRNYPAKAVLLGDAKVTLQKMIEVSKPRMQNTDWARRVKEITDEWRREVTPLCDSNDVPMRPERLCKELMDFLPADAVLVSDTGHAGIWTGTLVELRHSNQKYLRAAGSLGWALPASIGAKCAVPERPVICFTGDGGFWYHFAELETAVRYGINIIVVLNNNRSLNQSRKGYNDKASDDLWQYSEVDLSKLAQDMGCFAIRVEESAGLRPAFEQALDSARPAVVEVITDKDVVAPPPWASEKPKTEASIQP
ncbi:MAG: thiamine pyrophosphate-binding protein [Dehalococcoidales bacterium]|nr:thiamine pyrophosphate-binding protein [Dehalococcoidales bacterium]